MSGPKRKRADEALRRRFEAKEQQAIDMLARSIGHAAVRRVIERRRAGAKTVVMPIERLLTDLTTERLDLDVSAGGPGDAHAVIRADPPLGVAHLIVEDRLYPDTVPGSEQQRLQGRPDRRFPVAGAASFSRHSSPNALTASLNQAGASAPTLHLPDRESRACRKNTLRGNGNWPRRARRTIPGVSSARYLSGHFAEIIQPSEILYFGAVCVMTFSWFIWRRLMTRMRLREPVPRYRLHSRPAVRAGRVPGLCRSREDTLPEPPGRYPLLAVRG